MINKKTVFFGPFVGEFGWELLYWQGWVRRLCQKEFKDYHKIACSFIGRQPFYPDVDEFWPLTFKNIEGIISSRGYITDNWIKGLPKADGNNVKVVEIYPLLNKILMQFKDRLPRDTIFFAPWMLINDPLDNTCYGTFIPQNPKNSEEFKTYLIPYEKQILGPLQPTSKGIKLLGELIDEKEKLIAIFPRCRLTRRPDKNWTKEKYEVLIKSLQTEYPHFKIAVFGEPGGAFFSDGVPPGCLDLINVEPDSRLDIQIAALKQSKLALGGESGGLVFALAAGCPTLCWGSAGNHHIFKKDNYTLTKQYRYANKDASIKTITRLASWIINDEKKPILILTWNYILVSGYFLIPKCIRKSKFLAKIKFFVFKCFR